MKLKQFSRLNSLHIIFTSFVIAGKQQINKPVSWFYYQTKNEMALWTWSSKFETQTFVRLCLSYNWKCSSWNCMPVDAKSQHWNELLANSTWIKLVCTINEISLLVAIMSCTLLYIIWSWKKAKNIGDQHSTYVIITHKVAKLKYLYDMICSWTWPICSDCSSAHSIYIWCTNPSHQRQLQTVRTWK